MSSPPVTNAQLSVAFFMQMFVILLAARAVGALAKRIGQLQVVGEMVARVLLGPEFQRSPFWPDSLRCSCSWRG